MECCSSSNTCGLNEGDCDSDSDCSGNFVCHQRDTDSWVAVPGCLGGEVDGTGYDYCFDPEDCYNECNEKYDCDPDDNSFANRACRQGCKGKCDCPILDGRFPCYFFANGNNV